MHSAVLIVSAAWFRPSLLRLAVGCLLLACSLVSIAADWRAGIGRSRITPQEPMWMSGYAARDKPSEGTRTDLWAKALALEDAEGERAVLVTLDLVGIGAELSRSIRDRIASEHDLDRSHIVLCSSHTHTGPVVRENLQTMYQLSDEEWTKIARYSTNLTEKVVAVVDEAFGALAPARLGWGEGWETFAVNRRNNPESQVLERRQHAALRGPVDYSVPVLRIGDADNELVAVVFGYACHATVLSDYQWSGDYPGFAQAVFEEKNPGATALFWAGCGADINPLPRRSAELAESYGTRLAMAVTRTLEGVLKPVEGDLATSYSELQLAFEKLPTRSELEEDQRSENRYVAARAGELLRQFDENGSLDSSYAYPICYWRMGDDLKWVFLGGEVVVDYALRLKRELGPGTWITAYANDVMAYIPSRRVWEEGGYEGGGAMVYYGLPARWAPEVEELIIAEVHRQVSKE